MYPPTMTEPWCPRRRRSPTPFARLRIHPWSSSRGLRVAERTKEVNFYPGQNNAVDILILIANFSIPTGLRSAEAALSNQKARFVPECRSVVFPMVKHPFIVGFLVVELPKREVESEGQDVNQCPLPEECYALPPYTDPKSWDILTFKESPLEIYKFTADQKLNAINISCSLAMTYVMDQIFYLIGLAFFCLESLLSLWVLQKVYMYFVYAESVYVIHLFLNFTWRDTIIEIFYEKHLCQLIDVITSSCSQSGPAHKSVGSRSLENQTRVKREILLNICDLLCFCVFHHPYRINFCLQVQLSS